MGKGKLILVGSSNPTKINAVKQAFHLVYPKIKFKVIGKSVSSNVSDQPMGEKETFLGANNRVLGLLKDEANYYVGIEGGCCFIDKKLYAFALENNLSNSFFFSRYSLFSFVSPGSAHQPV